MFDFGLAELLLIAIVAILFIGPKELPVIMAQLGRVFKRLNYMRYALSSQFDEFMRQSGMDEVRNSVNFEAPKEAMSPEAAHEKALEVEMVEFEEEPAAKKSKGSLKKKTSKPKKSSSGSTGGSRAKKAKDSSVKPRNDSKPKKAKADG